MITSSPRIEPLASSVVVDENYLRVLLVDGREIAVPLEWFPHLRKATARQRRNWRLIGGGVGIHWLDTDDDVIVEDLLACQTRSQSGKRSLKQETPTASRPPRSTKASR